MPLRNLNGDLSLEQTQQSVLAALNTLRTLTEHLIDVAEMIGSPLTNAQLRQSPVSVANPTLNVVGAGSATNSQRVHLSDESLAALENINVMVGEVEIKNEVNNPIPIQGRVFTLGQLIPAEYDEVQLAYEGENVKTLTYRKSNATVATLSLSYTDDLLTGVKRQ